MYEINANSNLDEQYISTLKPSSVESYRWASKIFKDFLLERSDVRDEDVIFREF